MTAESRDAGGGLFPPIEPYAVHRMRVSGIHEIHVEECGNPEGQPVIILHGGPGSGCNPTMRRYHDPAHYRIVLFDQRGCGRSTPHAELEENTTFDLVADMERVRLHLGIERWQLFGGSWGSCLALAYAETHPERCSALVLRGIFTMREAELRWFYQEGASWLLPEAFARFRAEIPEEEQDDLIAAYHRRLTGSDEAARLSAARVWSMWEGGALSLIPDPGRVAAFGTPHYAIAFARIECHYFVNRGFFARDGQLLQDAGRLKDIPGVIVHGRYDLCTPVANAVALNEAWPRSELVIIPDAGHAMSEPGILKAMMAAAERFREPVALPAEVPPRS